MHEVGRMRRTGIRHAGAALLASAMGISVLAVPAAAGGGPPSYTEWFIQSVPYASVDICNHGAIAEGVRYAQKVKREFVAGSSLTVKFKKANPNRPCWGKLLTTFSYEDRDAASVGITVVYNEGDSPTNLTWFAHEEAIDNEPTNAQDTVEVLVANFGSELGDFWLAAPEIGPASVGPTQPDVDFGEAFTIEAGTGGYTYWLSDPGALDPQFRMGSKRFEHGTAYALVAVGGSPTTSRWAVVRTPVVDIP